MPLNRFLVSQLMSLFQSKLPCAPKKIRPSNILTTADQGVSTERLWGSPHAVLDPQEPWELVPTSIIACSTWCYVKRKERGKRTRGLFYSDPGPSAEPMAVYPVTLRLQGYISSCNLSPLGTWNG